MASLNMKGKKTFTIDRFLGVNECADGDTSLKFGEASKTSNFKVTSEWNLQKRPGTKNVAGLMFEYAIDVSDETISLKEESIATTTTFKVKPNVDISDTGLLSIDGAESTMNYANHDTYTGYYYKDSNDLIYKFADCLYDDGIVEGVQQYRWAKHNCNVYSDYYYTLSWRYTQTLYDPNGMTGQTGYSFNSSTGAFSPTGGHMTIQNSGTVYGNRSRVVAAGGNNFDFYSAEINGPYYDTSYSKGSTFLGYVYGATSDYPNNGQMIVDGTRYWFSEKTSKKGYSWLFYPVTAGINSADKVVRGIWSGYVDGTEYIVAACNGYLWSLEEDTEGVWSKTNIGAIDTSNHVHFFGYDEKIYILNGIEYLVWDASTYGKQTYTADGTELAGDYYFTINTDDYVFTLAEALTAGDILIFSEYDESLTLNGAPVTVAIDTVTVETDLTASLVSSVHYAPAQTVTGYRPLIATATPNAGGGTLVERINRMCALKRQEFSPNGTDAFFHLADADIASVDFVKLNGETKIETTDYTYDLVTGVVTFVNAPTSGINTVEIGWTGKSNDKATVTGMRYSEFYNGTTDNRVFLYGNGTNKAIYSGLDENGQATAEYFPDLNEVLVGDENTPITGMVRHYDSLLAFKLDSAYRINYNTLTLADDTMTAGFYVKPVNRGIGNNAYGQAMLVENNARTLDGRSLYEWASGGTLTNDQRNAQRISQRIEKTLHEMVLQDAITYFDKINHEYYIMQNGTAIVQNTELDVWYVYDNFPATCMIVYADEVYIGTDDGYIRHVSRDYRNDNGVSYACNWESGSLDFGLSTYEKMLTNIHVTMRPENSCRIYADIQTDVKASYTDGKPISIPFGLLDFANIDFEHFSFGTNSRIRNKTVKFKVNRFVYGKIMLTLNDKDATATVTSISIPILYTGEAR